MKTCSRCRALKPETEFHRTRASADGRVSHCKTCDAASRRTIACSVTVTEKYCSRCDRTLPIKNFHRNRAARDGHQAYCKDCGASVQREYFERNAELIALRHARKLAEPIGVDKTKKCRKCGAVKPLLEFYAHRGTADRRANYCKKCANAQDLERRHRNAEKNRAYMAAWRAANVEKRRKMMRDWNLRLYGLRPDDYIAIYEAQGGKCKICGKNGEEFNGRRLHVDHDHETNKVRGLLCGLCNSALGKFHDSPELLRTAASYIEEAQNS